MTTFHDRIRSESQSHRIPPLENGDRLPRPEFERRYAAATHTHKAELIEGVVYVASPVRHLQHGKPHSRLVTWLGIYQAMTPGVDLSNAPTVRLDMDNEPQPDAVLFVAPDAGGRVQVNSDGYLEGSPELIVEIAASAAAIDLGSKRQAYRRNGVQEYVVWQVYENQLLWYHLVEGEYQALSPDEAGIVRSQMFPGLWLSVDDLLTGNMAKVLEVVQVGTRSPEHQTFALQLSMT